MRALALRMLRPLGLRPPGGAALLLLTAALALVAPRVAAALSDEQYATLVDALKNADSYKIRLQAAVVLGRAGGPRAVDPLTEALDDPEMAVRASACMALGNLADLRAVTGLVKALDDDDGFVRGEAKSALVKLAGPNAVPYLVQGEERRSPRVRLALAQVIASVQGPEAARAMVEFLQDDDPAPLAVAERVLSERPLVEVHPGLLAGLSHPSYLVRQRSAQLAGERRDAGVLRRLAEIYIDDVEPPEVRDAARGALAVMKDRLDAQNLAIEARSAPPEDRARALSLLGVVGGERAFKTCLAALNDPDVYVRGAAAIALGDLGDRRALADLRDLLDRPQNVRILKVVKGAVARIEKASPASAKN